MSHHHHRMRAGRTVRRQCADESGGAVSLWVVLMVPVSAFAAVVAMAGPQRMAAQSSIEEAADDLAAVAVAWRDGRNTPEGALPAFPPGCADTERDNTVDGYAFWVSEVNRLTQIAEELEREIPRPPEDVIQRAWGDVEPAKAERDRREEAIVLWEGACEFLYEALIRDLGNLGVDVGTLKGFYSDALGTSSGGTVPCKISERAEVREAVHVALAADWLYAGWAAAQVWPDGTRLGAESIGRMRRSVDASTLTDLCDEQLDVLDARGRPVVLEDPDAPSRRLSQGVPGSSVIEG